MQNFDLNLMLELWTGGLSCYRSARYVLNSLIDSFQNTLTGSEEVQEESRNLPAVGKLPYLSAYKWQFFVFV